MQKFVKAMRMHIILYLVIIIGMIGLSLWAGIPWYWGVAIGVIGIIFETVRQWFPFFD